MLYRMLKRMIERNQTDGLAEKIDVFYAHSRITKAEYEDLLAMINSAVKE